MWYNDCRNKNSSFCKIQVFLTSFTITPKKIGLFQNNCFEECLATVEGKKCLVSTDVNNINCEN